MFVIGRRGVVLLFIFGVVIGVQGMSKEAANLARQNNFYILLDINPDLELSEQQNIARNITKTEKQGTAKWIAADVFVNNRAKQSYDERFGKNHQEEARKIKAIHDKKRSLELLKSGGYVDKILANIRKEIGQIVQETIKEKCPAISSPNIKKEKKSQPSFEQSKAPMKEKSVDETLEELEAELKREFSTTTPSTPMSRMRSGSAAKRSSFRRERMGSLPVVKEKE